MIHRGLLFWSVAAVATAVGLFTVKYKVQDLEEKIDRTNQKICLLYTSDAADE